MSVSLPVDRSGPPAVSSGSRLGRLVGTPWLWVAIAALGLAVPMATRMLRPPPAPLPEYGSLPSFSLVAEDGRGFGSKELAGHVWVAGFIFTRCPTICPAITATMGRIQHRTRGIHQGFRMVSFSVDPTYDTPAVLAAYARQHKASPRVWKFLTGPPEAVKAAVVDGLKIAMGETEPPAAPASAAPASAAPAPERDFASVMHGTHFVLLDQKARIRGYYDSSDADVVDRILGDAAMLVNGSL
jgi:protein SCO1